MGEQMPTMPASENKLSEAEQLELSELKEIIGPVPIKIEYSGNDEELNRRKAKIEEFEKLPPEEQAQKKARLEELIQKRGSVARIGF